jgi:hypothetical protein
MEQQKKDLIKRLEAEINETPTGNLRNLLTDANILIQSLSIPDNYNKKCVHENHDHTLDFNGFGGVVKRCKNCGCNYV